MLKSDRNVCTSAQLAHGHSVYEMAQLLNQGFVPLITHRPSHICSGPLLRRLLFEEMALQMSSFEACRFIPDFLGSKLQGYFTALDESNSAALYTL